LRRDQFARVVGGAVNANRGSGQSPVSGTATLAAYRRLASICAGLEQLVMLLKTEIIMLILTGLLSQGYQTIAVSLKKFRCCY
jgi:hypothetical protein